MDTLFREFSELMDDANDKMPEGTYLAIYDKLKELRDESKKNTEVDRIRLFYLAIIGEQSQAKKVSDAKIKELEESALRSRPRCRCGSTDHLKTNFLGCRLNKRVLAGVLGTAARDRALAETAALANPPTEV
jgi:hypothetical protein